MPTGARLIGPRSVLCNGLLHDRVALDGRISRNRSDRRSHRCRRYGCAAFLNIGGIAAGNDCPPSDIPPFMSAEVGVPGVGETEGAGVTGAPLWGGKLSKLPTVVMVVGTVIGGTAVPSGATSEALLRANSVDRLVGTAYAWAKSAAGTEAWICPSSPIVALFIIGARFSGTFAPAIVAASAAVMSTVSPLTFTPKPWSDRALDP